MRANPASLGLAQRVHLGASPQVWWMKWLPVGREASRVGRPGEARPEKVPRGVRPHRQAANSRSTTG